MSNVLLKPLFEQKHVGFRNIDLFSSSNKPVATITKQSQISCSLLSCDREFFIALYPATHKFDLSRLNKAVDKKLYPVGSKENEKFDFELLINLIQDSSSKYWMHVFVDEALENQDELYVLDEDGKHAYAIDIQQLQKLSSDELIGISFSDEMDLNMDAKEKLSFKERVKALHSLPPMPDTASKILKLRSIPDIKVEQIVAVIEKDPILVAQIVSYANSAFFGQAGSVKSLKDAIFRVLGVDAVMNMALALSVGSVFKIPQSGPVGAKAIWKTSIYTASLMQRLSMLMPWGKRPNPGTAYLIGLLNDIGLLILGHLYSEEFSELNDYIENNSEVSIFTAEHHVLGITHTEVGKIVMRMWNMPEELIAVATHQQDNNYNGEHENYIQLLTVVNTLLAPHGLLYGDSSEELPLDLLEKLSLDEEDVIVAADEVLSEGEIIKDLVKQMCA